MSHAAAAPGRPGSPAGRPGVFGSCTRQDNRTCTHAFSEDAVHRCACFVGRRTAVRFSSTDPSGIVTPTPTATGGAQSALVAERQRSRREAGVRECGMRSLREPVALAFLRPEGGRHERSRQLGEPRSAAGPRHTPDGDPPPRSQAPSGQLPRKALRRLAAPRTSAPGWDLRGAHPCPTAVVQLGTRRKPIVITSSRQEDRTGPMTGPRRDAGRIPAEVTTFVGRQHEMSQARTLLTRSRLLTLTGAGGIGKTRLALRVARDVRRSFPDGAWVVDLGPVEDGALLAQTVLAALGLDHSSALPALTVLVDHLADKQLLLVLDNCEHLLNASAVLVRMLLAAAPGLKVLVTSRQSLGIDAESLLTVPPLSTPDPDRPPPPKAMMRYAAVQLFVERASAVLGDFTLGEDDRLAVAGICHRLDGIPLAIELAAARVRVLCPQQLLTVLDDRFALLDQGSRAAPARQQTLRAAIDCSFDLCTPQEQWGWARLSVFCGGFDLEAAEAVCAGEELAREQVLGVIAELVDKSVLTMESRRGLGRYRMLETIREYGRDLLRLGGEETAVRRRHRDHYRALAARAEADWFSARQENWSTRLYLERTNIRAALEFCLSTPHDVGAGLALATSLWGNALGAGNLDEQRRWLGQALARDTEPTPARVRALWADGWLALLLGDFSTAKARLDACQDLAERLGDAESLAHAVQFAGLTALFGGDFPAAVRLLEEAYDRHRATADLWAEWTALFLLALVYCLTDNPRASAMAEQCLALCDAHDARWSRSYPLWLLGLQHWLGGDAQRAIPLLQDGLRIARSGRNLLCAAQCLEVLAWATAKDGCGEQAAALLGAAQTTWQSAGIALPGLGRLLHYHSECEARLRASLGDTAYAAAVKMGTELTLDEATDYALGEPPTPPTTLRPAHPPMPLTRRQRQVIELLAQGLTDKQIAGKLVLSPRTVEGHVYRLLAVLGFDSRTQIATWAVENSTPGHGVHHESGSVRPGAAR
ncbi:LuxR C-terminal-related transcriptional regulator [Streptomyces sp. NPDC048506]|uniref:LuxR C-terminal-related transcriptional regulator n=1 Tax=Streptomyces sp. NPDC048506 TaxID=3155028 RepID=UPI0034193F7A